MSALGGARQVVAQVTDASKSSINRFHLTVGFRFGLVPILRPSFLHNSRPLTREQLYEKTMYRDVGSALRRKRLRPGLYPLQ